MIPPAFNWLKDFGEYFTGGITFERDPGFREVMHRYFRIGLYVSGTVGALAIIAFVLSNLLFAGKQLVWTYANANPRYDLVFWDKLIALVTCLALIWIARFSVGIQWGRFFAGLVVVFLCIAFLMDDVANGDISSSGSYLTLVLLLATGTIPLQPWQTLLLSLLVTTIFFGLAHTLPSSLASDPDQKLIGQFIFLIMVSIVLTGISTLIYKSRYEEYLARVRAEELGRQVTAQTEQMLEMERAKARDLQAAYHSLEQSHLNLKQVHIHLVQAEKMASLGRLTAGIAHEIKNPLNFVSNFALNLIELISELQAELSALNRKGGTAALGHLDALLVETREACEKITHHSKRADLVVQRMLMHTHGKTGQPRKTDVNALLNDCVDITCGSFRAEWESFDVRVIRELDPSLVPIEIAPPEMSHVFLSVLNNAFQAVLTKQKQKSTAFLPTVKASTRKLDQEVEIRVEDNGPGIPDSLRYSIFEPFFKSNNEGYGMGLGLSISYDIVVKMHRGSIVVDGEEGEGTTIIIRLPERRKWLSIDDDESDRYTISGNL